MHLQKNKKKKYSLIAKSRLIKRRRINSVVGFMRSWNCRRNRYEGTWRTTGENRYLVFCMVLSNSLRCIGIGIKWTGAEFSTGQRLQERPFKHEANATWEPKKTKKNKKQKTSLHTSENRDSRARGHRDPATNLNNTTLKRINSWRNYYKQLNGKILMLPKPSISTIRDVSNQVYSEKFRFFFNYVDNASRAVRCMKSPIEMGPGEMEITGQVTKSR